MTSLGSDKHSEEKKFPKEEKLTSKKIIEELFNKGSSLHLYPYRLFFDPGPPENPAGKPQVLITVPKRIFKRAVDRNRIRRQIKEAYRLNKTAIFREFDFEKIPKFMAILYTSKEKLPFKKLEEKLILILERLKKS